MQAHVPAVLDILNITGPTRPEPPNTSIVTYVSLYFGVMGAVPTPPSFNWKIDPCPAGKLRRVLCKAAGPCQAVALPRASLEALDAPQLAGVLDLEAADAVLQVWTVISGIA